MAEQLGLTECVSIALGGMIGGGIYAVLGVVAKLTMAATWFASLSFIVVFGVVSLLAFHERDADDVHPVPPALGAVGTVAVELIYFERELLEQELASTEDSVGSLR